MSNPLHEVTVRIDQHRSSLRAIRRYIEAQTPPWEAPTIHLLEASAHLVEAITALTKATASLREHQKRR